MKNTDVLANAFARALILSIIGIGTSCVLWVSYVAFRIATESILSIDMSKWPVNILFYICATLVVVINARNNINNIREKYNNKEAFVLLFLVCATVIFSNLFMKGIYYALYGEGIFYRSDLAVGTAIVVFCIAVIATGYEFRGKHNTSSGDTMS